MKIEISIEDMWFSQFLYDDDSTTLKMIEDEIEIQLEHTLRGAIEGVPNIQSERINIDLKKNDT